MHSTLSTARRSRPSGVAGVEDVPWGAHICQFYRTTEDLFDVLVPYFKAGLESNEQCLWLASEPLRAEAARSALLEAIPDLAIYETRGQMDIFNYEDVYGDAPSDEVIRSWAQREESALRSGYEGLRVTGDVLAVEGPDRGRLADGEGAVAGLLQGRRVVIICTYCIEHRSPNDTLEVLETHPSTLMRSPRGWQLVRRSGEKRAASRSGPSSNGPPEVHAGHDVYFYEDDAFPARRVGAFLAGSLRSGGAAVAIATAAHLAPIYGWLASARVDVDAAVRRGQLHLLDAEKILGWLHVGGSLDEREFAGLVGGRLREATARFPSVRLFGELVELLASQGREADALRLEGWWNRLREQVPFELLCAYSYASFAQLHSVARFEDVCATHHGVEGGEAPRIDVDHKRLVAQIRQRTVALGSAAARSRRFETERTRILQLSGASASQARSSTQLIRLQRVTAALSAAGTVEAVQRVARTDLMVAAGASEVFMAAGPGLGHLAGPREIGDEGPGARDLEAAFRHGAAVWPAAGASGEPPIVALPLETGTRRLGAVGFVYQVLREFTTTERGFLDDLARQLAVALDREGSRLAAAGEVEPARQRVARGLARRLLGRFSRD